MAAKPGKTILDLLKANMHSKQANPSKKGSSSKVSTPGTTRNNAETVGSSHGDNSVPNQDHGTTSKRNELLELSNAAHDSVASSSTPSNGAACVEPELLLPTFLKWKGAAKNGEPDLHAFWSRADGFFPESRPTEWVVNQTQPLHPPADDSDPAFADVMFGELFEWRPGMDFELPPRVALAEAGDSDSDDAADDIGANDRNAKTRSKRSHRARKGERRRRPDDRQRDRQRKKPPASDEPVPPSSDAALNEMGAPRACTQNQDNDMESNVSIGQFYDDNDDDGDGDVDGYNYGNQHDDNYNNDLDGDKIDAKEVTVGSNDNVHDISEGNAHIEFDRVTSVSASTPSNAASVPSQGQLCITARLETDHGIKIASFELSEADGGFCTTTKDASFTGQSQLASKDSSKDLSMADHQALTPEPSSWLQAALEKRTPNASDATSVLSPARVHALLVSFSSPRNNHSGSLSTPMEEELSYDRVGTNGVSSEISAPRDASSREEQTVEKILKLAQSQLRELDRNSSSYLEVGLAAVKCAHGQYEAKQVAALSTERACNDAALSRSISEALVRGLADQDPDFNRWRDEEDMPASWRLDVPTRATRQSAAHAAASSTGDAADVATTAAPESSDDVVCAVCHTGIVCSDLNQLVYCDGCNVVLHQGCGGIPQVSPNEDWFCAACSAGLPVNVDDATNSSILARSSGVASNASRSNNGNVAPPPSLSSGIGVLPVYSENKPTEAEFSTPRPTGSSDTPIDGGRTPAASLMPNKAAPSPLSPWTICCPVYHGGVKPAKVSNMTSSADPALGGAASVATSTSSTIISSSAPDAGLIKVDADGKDESANQWVHLACCVWQEGVQVGDLETMPFVDVTHVRAQPLQPEPRMVSVVTLSTDSRSSTSTKASMASTTSSSSGADVSDEPGPNKTPSSAIKSSSATDTLSQVASAAHSANVEVAFSGAQALPLTNSSSIETAAAPSASALPTPLQDANSIVSSSAPVNPPSTNSIVTQSSGASAPSSSVSSSITEPSHATSTSMASTAAPPIVPTDDRAAALAEQRRLQENQIAELQRALREKQAAAAAAPPLPPQAPASSNGTIIPPREASSLATATAEASDQQGIEASSSIQTSPPAVPQNTPEASIDNIAAIKALDTTAGSRGEYECCVCGLVGGYLVGCSGATYADAPNSNREHPQPPSSSKCNVRFHALCGWFAGFCMLASMEPNANFIRKEAEAAAYHNNSSSATPSIEPKAYDQSIGSAQAAAGSDGLSPHSVAAPSASKAYPVGLVFKAFCPLHVPASHQARSQAEQMAIRGKYRLQPPVTFGAATAAGGGGNKGRKRARSSSGATRGNKRGFNRQQGDSAVELVGMAYTNNNSNRNSNVGFSVVDGYTEFTCAVCLEPRANILGEEASIFGQLSKPTIQCSRCSVSVHYGCYGLALDNNSSATAEGSDISSSAASPLNSWLCDSCEFTSGRSNSAAEPHGALGPRCVLCPRGGGVHVRASAEKAPSTSSSTVESTMPVLSGWAHLTCAISVPGSRVNSDGSSEITLPPTHPPQETTAAGTDLKIDDAGMNPAIMPLPAVSPSTKILRRHIWVDASLALDPNAIVNNNNLPAPSRPKPKCPFCGLRSGICVPCADPRCVTAFHPICAQLAGCFSVPAPGSNDLYNATVASTRSNEQAAATADITVSTAPGDFSGDIRSYCRRHAPPGWTRLEALDSDGAVVRSSGGKQFARGKVASSGSSSGSGPAQWVHVDLAKSLKRSLEQGQERLTTAIQRDEDAADASVDATEKFYASLQATLAARGCDTGPAATAAAALGAKTVPKDPSDDVTPAISTATPDGTAATNTATVGTTLANTVDAQEEAPAAVLDPWVLNLDESLKLLNEASNLEYREDAAQWSSMQPSNGEDGHWNQTGQFGGSVRSRSRNRKSEAPRQVHHSTPTEAQPVPPEAMVAAALAAAKAVLSSPPPPSALSSSSSSSSVLPASQPGSPPVNSNGKKRKGRPPGSGSKQRFHAAAQAATAAATHAASGLATHLFPEGGVDVAVSAAVKLAMEEVSASNLTSERSGLVGRPRASSSGSVAGSSVASGEGRGHSGSANESRAESFDHEDSSWASFTGNSSNSTSSSSNSSSSSSGLDGGIPAASNVDWVADLGFGDSNDGLGLLVTDTVNGVDGALPLFPAESTIFASDLVDSHVPMNLSFPERSSEFPSSAPKRIKTSHAKANNGPSNGKAGGGGNAKMKTINSYFTPTAPRNASVGEMPSHAAERAAQCVSRIEATNATRSAVAAGITATSGTTGAFFSSGTPGSSGAGNSANGNKESALRHARQAPSCVFRGVSERLTHPPTSFGDALRFAILPNAFPVLKAPSPPSHLPVTNARITSTPQSSNSALAMESVENNIDSVSLVGSSALPSANDSISTSVAADRLAAAKSTDLPTSAASTTAVRVLLDRQLLELYLALEQKRVSVADAPSDSQLLTHSNSGGNFKSEVGATTAALGTAAGAAQAPMRLLCEPFYAKPDPTVFRKLYEECATKAIAKRNTSGNVDMSHNSSSTADDDGLEGQPLCMLDLKARVQQRAYTYLEDLVIDVEALCDQAPFMGRSGSGRASAVVLRNAAELRALCRETAYRIQCDTEKAVRAAAIEHAKSAGINNIQNISKSNNSNSELPLPLLPPSSQPNRQHVSLGKSTKPDSKVTSLLCSLCGLRCLTLTSEIRPRSSSDLGAGNNSSNSNSGGKSSGRSNNNRQRALSELHVEEWVCAGCCEGATTSGAFVGRRIAVHSSALSAAPAGGAGTAAAAGASGAGRGADVAWCYGVIDAFEPLSRQHRVMYGVDGSWEYMHLASRYLRYEPPTLTSDLSLAMD